VLQQVVADQKNVEELLDRLDMRLEELEWLARDWEKVTQSVPGFKSRHSGLRRAFQEAAPDYAHLVKEATALLAAIGQLEKEHAGLVTTSKEHLAQWTAQFQSIETELNQYIQSQELNFGSAVEQMLAEVENWLSESAECASPALTDLKRMDQNAGRLYNRAQEKVQWALDQTREYRERKKRVQLLLEEVQRKLSEMSQLREGGEAWNAPNWYIAEIAGAESALVPITMQMEGVDSEDARHDLGWVRSQLISMETSLKRIQGSVEEAVECVKINLAALGQKNRNYENNYHRCETLAARNSKAQNQLDGLRVELADLANRLQNASSYDEASRTLERGNTLLLDLLNRFR